MIADVDLVTNPPRVVLKSTGEIVESLADLARQTGDRIFKDLLMTITDQEAKRAADRAALDLP